jgi:hypothetical protein
LGATGTAGVASEATGTSSGFGASDALGVSEGEFVSDEATNTNPNAADVTSRHPTPASTAIRITHPHAPDRTEAQQLK